VRTCTRTKIGAWLTFRSNAHTDARRRRRRFNVGGVRILHTPPASKLNTASFSARSSTVPAAKLFTSAAMPLSQGQVVNRARRVKI